MSKCGRRRPGCPDGPASIGNGLIALLIPLFAAGAAAGGLQAYDLSAEPYRQWKLPDKLYEISGLAVTTDGRLLAVTDELAIVYELDYEQGRLVKAFAMGDPTVRGDFEGIAARDGRVWLVTSDGVILESAEGEDGQRVAYETHRTGAGRSCEIEGLAHRRAEGVLLLLCKQLRRDAELESLAVFSWSIADRKLLPGQTVLLPEERILAELQRDRLRPSGIAIDERSGNMLIVASRPGAVIELAFDGAVSAAPLASGDRHRQPEGIEILPDGRLLIADEGAGRRARLAVYAPAGREGAGQP